MSGSWSRQRRVIAKAEHLEGKENPRFVVTSLSPQEWPAQKLYEQLYCARGDMEKPHQGTTLSVRRSRQHRNSARQSIIMYFSAIAYTLLQALRRLGLPETDLAQAQCLTLRLKLLKIGALFGSACVVSTCCWPAAIPCLGASIANCKLCPQSLSIPPFHQPRSTRTVLQTLRNFPTQTMPPGLAGLG